jgi:uncharacterized protein YyaL (SSP411 family)
MTHKHTNALIQESSPYLLQHAHNPVNWRGWHPEVLEEAKKQNKLLLISIGYAACHWCHVMEKECFEDEEVAKVMNTHFVNIKIDREERPDIDHIYMDALQMMTGSGGWPLNIVALPDGRPFWGATYVKKQQWMQILEQLAKLYQDDPKKVMGYAQDLTEGIKTVNLVETSKEEVPFNLEHLHTAVKSWSGYFDTTYGGYNRAPKFMMPTNLDFLLHYGTVFEDKTILDYVNLSLTKMAYGGLFDQIGGGFSRYSVDTKWHIPHFEKMLYDNGQLISVYAKAYALTKNNLYKQIVEKTIHFITKELMNSKGGFYSSLDADSLNEAGILEEGAYYVWTKDELKELLQSDYTLFKDYYNINDFGHWEHRNYVLIRKDSDEEIATKHNLSIDTLYKNINTSHELLLKARNKRSGPRLDDKILTSWNGLMIKGLIDAYRYVGDDSYLEIALTNAEFLEKYLYQDDGGLFHNHKNGKSTIHGYLEDYSSLIDAYIGLYEVSFNEHWLQRAQALTDYCIDNFFDPDSKLFFFSSVKDEFLIRRTLEKTDNVVPASNSMMAKNLFKLSRILQLETYDELSKKMGAVMQDQFDKSASNYSNWLHLVLYAQRPFYEIAIVGSNYKTCSKEMQGLYIPNAIYSGTDKTSELVLLQNRFVKNETKIYVCQQGSCKLPVTNSADALKLLD